MRKKVFKKMSLLMANVLILANMPTNNAPIYADETEQEYIIVLENNNDSEELFKNMSYEKIDNDGKIVSVNMTGKEVKKLKKNENVESVENIIMLEGSQSSNNHETDSDNAEWNIDMINANGQEVNDSDKITVAVIDSGVNFNSSVDIKKRINLVEGEDNMSPLYEDYSGHGTAIAGIIAGQDEDGYQIGVDNNAEIISIKVLDENNSATVDKIIEAIYIAIDENVDIINMSFGTVHYSEALHRAIKDAYNSGILIVAAAGNRGTTDNAIEYPAAFDEVMSVGSVDCQGEISDSSSSGENVDVYAPGETIKSTAIFDGTMVCSGTSLAVPHVVGVASKLWSKDKNKNADFIKNLIIDSANEATNTKIIDLGYALSIYDEYSIDYDETGEEINDTYDDNGELNTSEVDSDLVEGSWSQPNHQKAIERYSTLSTSKKKYSDRALKLLIAGIRLADEDKINLAFNKGDGLDKEHGWWHAGTRNIDVNTSFVLNYFSTMEFLQRVIHTENCDISKVSKPAGMADCVYTAAKKTLKKAIIDFDFGEYNRNSTNTRYVYYGILMHTATDLFAHRIFVKHTDGIYYYITNKQTIGMQTDDVNDIKERYILACNTVRSIMDDCINPEKPYQSQNVTLAQFAAYPVYYSGRFKVQNFYEFAVESGWYNSASDSVKKIIKDNSIQNAYYKASLIY